MWELRPAPAVPNKKALRENYYKKAGVVIPACNTDTYLDLHCYKILPKSLKGQRC